MNTLYYGDNLHYLREFDSRSVDLVYLDPPFNSKAMYNLLFHTPEGEVAEAQTNAFKDMWWWDRPAEEAYDDVMASGSPAGDILRSLRSFLGTSDTMAYLAMMTVRIIELRRILRDTGSIYLHCDPTASHYLKVMLDGIFGVEGYRNEIVWRRTNAHNLKARQFGRIHDTILFYSCSKKYTWNQEFAPYSEAQLSRYKRDKDERLYKAENLTMVSAAKTRNFEWRGARPPANRGWGASLEQLEEWWDAGLILKKRDGSPRLDGLKVYLDQMPGKPIDDMWADIARVGNTSKERVGYPTQKPIALLERVISSSSNEGDVVLDPFCGCGTTVEAAERLGRNWVGIDISHHAIDIIESRLEKRFPRSEYEIKGRPEDMESAWALARRDPFEFQRWSNWLLGAQTYREYKRGPDRGIDGNIYFRNGPWGTGHIVVSVKAGENLNPDMIRALGGVVDREKANLGVFVCIANPTAGMRREATSAGFVRTAQGRFAKIQIVEIKDLLGGQLPPLPTPIETQAFTLALRPRRRAPAKVQTEQLTLPLPIVGGRGRRTDGVEEHLSGRILAEVAAAN